MKILQPSAFSLQPSREAGYLLTDEASGVAEMEKRTEPKVRVVEGIIIGAMVGATLVVVLIAGAVLFHLSHH